MALQHRFQQDRGLGEGAALEKRMGQHRKRLHIVRAGGQMSPQRGFARLRLAPRLPRGRLGDQRFADRRGDVAPIRFVGGAPVVGQKQKIGERPPADRHIRPRGDRATKGGDRLGGLAEGRKALAQFIEDDRIAPVGLGQRPEEGQRLRRRTLAAPRAGQQQRGRRMSGRRFQNGLRPVRGLSGNSRQGSLQSAAARCEERTRRASFG